MKKAFTLVELIIVITILAILATIAFISLNGYASNSRDSKRLSDIASMKKVLELSYLKNNHYPEPDNVVNITYSWSLAWYMWEFWEEVRRKVERINPVPRDPITETNYAYGLTNNRQEYELWAMLENSNNVSYSVISKANANSEWYTAYISWNYNKKILSIRTGSRIMILWVPTLITTDVSITELKTITDQERRSLFSINKKTNLPGNVIEKINTWILWEWFIVTREEIYENGDIENKDINGWEESLLLYEWDISDLSNETTKEKVWENIISYYRWTESTIWNLYQEMTWVNWITLVDTLINNRQWWLNSKDISLSSNTDEGWWSSSWGWVTNSFSWIWTIEDPYRFSWENITDITVIANNCNYYNVNAITLNNWTIRWVWTCGVMWSWDKECLSNWIYMIDNDGIWWNNAIKVYCDMTNDEWWWTMVVRWTKWNYNHRNINSVWTLEWPLQTTTYKLSDSIITSITSSIYRTQNDQWVNQYTDYFDTSDTFKSTTQSSSKVKKVYNWTTWYGPYLNPWHIWFNTYQWAWFAWSPYSGTWGFVYSESASSSCRFWFFLNWDGFTPWCSIWNSWSIFSK